MLQFFSPFRVPKYRGVEWLPEGLPKKTRHWQVKPSVHRRLGGVLRKATQTTPWQWPSAPIYFISDAHADAEAFVASLVASGGVERTGIHNQDFKLTKSGHKALFIIGGDCLDKGPSNLDLLDAINVLRQQGANVKLLAGNHDMRLLMGLKSLQNEKHPLTDHLFVRMGPKVIPLLKEVHQRYLAGKPYRAMTPESELCRRFLFPNDQWFSTFPHLASRLMPTAAIDKEVSRMSDKIAKFEQRCEAVGLDIRDVYATAKYCQELFLKPEGEYGWFFEEMDLVYREGSFLFLHAGLDDNISSKLNTAGIQSLNQEFKKLIDEDLFGFYYGPLANALRTKYRAVDFPLTEQGVTTANSQGVHAVVHGHRNCLEGQRIMLREGMLHIEGDVTLDRNSRKKEGLTGHGMGVTIIHPKGHVLGISNDFPHAKVFKPEHFYD